MEHNTDSDPTLRVRDGATIPSSWRLMRSGPCSYDYNMAMDEALLLAMPRLELPVLRFYGWTQPAASFGYFQKYADVERLTPLRPLVRRSSGGGIVPHDADWTYSLAFPTRAGWYDLAATESYRRIHAWIQSAFAALGVRTDLAQQAIHAQPGQCFVGYEKSDVLYRGRKIAGAAQRRTRDGLLIQGSVHSPSESLTRKEWESAMLDTAHREQQVTWREFSPDEPIQQRVAELIKTKYSRNEFNQKR